MMSDDAREDVTDQSTAPEPASEELARFEHAGHTCRVTLIRGTHFCGYVQTDFPDTLSYDDITNQCDIRVHGGLTYGVDGEGWVGFDCAHAGDRCVNSEGESLAQQVYDLELTVIADDYVQEWTLDDVRQETKRLAEQVAECDVRFG